jgi:tetratricopeptide (TPR) repeat protein
VPRILLLMKVAAALLTCCAVALAAIPPQSDGFSAFYNLDYDRALAIFDSAVRGNPDDPEGWNHLAQTILYRRLYLDGALTSDLVGHSNAFLRRPKVVMPPEEEKSFLGAIDQAVQLGARRLQKNPRDAEALYALGVANANRAYFDLLVKKSWFDALRDSNRGAAFHNRLRRLRPGDPDALLVPGMQAYAAGCLPLWVRLLVSMAGIRGSREEGLTMVERAAREGRKTGVEATILLAVLYNREGRPADAAALMRELSEAFPRNYLYRSEQVLLLARAGRAREAREDLARLEAMKRMGAPETAHMSDEMLVRLREGVERRLQARQNLPAQP